MKRLPLIELETRRKICGNFIVKIRIRPEIARIVLPLPDDSLPLEHPDICSPQPANSRWQIIGDDKRISVYGNRSWGSTQLNSAILRAVAAYSKAGAVIELRYPYTTLAVEAWLEALREEVSRIYHESMAPVVFKMHLITYEERGVRK